MSKKKVLLRGVFINRDTNGEGVLKVGTTLIRVSTVMGILYFFYINGNKYEYQDVIKCEIHYFDYFFINVLCLHIDMKNTSKSPILLYSEDLDEGIDDKDIQLFKFYESVSENLRIS